METQLKDLETNLGNDIPVLSYNDLLKQVDHPNTGPNPNSVIDDPVDSLPPIPPPTIVLANNQNQNQNQNQNNMQGQNRSVGAAAEDSLTHHLPESESVNNNVRNPESTHPNPNMSHDMIFYGERGPNRSIQNYNMNPQGNFMNTYGGDASGVGGSGRYPFPPPPIASSTPSLSKFSSLWSCQRMVQARKHASSIAFFTLVIFVLSNENIRKRLFDIIPQRTPFHTIGVRNLILAVTAASAIQSFIILQK